MEVTVSYDDAESFAAKGHFINTQGLLGFTMWEAGGDYQDILLDSGAMGILEVFTHSLFFLYTKHLTFYHPHSFHSFIHVWGY